MTNPDSPTDVVVVCDGAGRTFGTGAAAIVALQGATAQIRRGDRIALMGQSGSGKSTLLHLFAGLDLATTGSVSWPGIGRRSALRPGPVGIVFQAPSLIPALDVLENVALPLVLMGKRGPDATNAAAEALERLAIGDLADKLPEELSGGQAQRVSIARVLAHEPILILADEPTGQLDHEAARTVIDALIEAADTTNAALVVSTHDPDIAAQFATRWSVTDGRLTTALQGDSGEVLCSA
jgi:ABC-type lipoprotein export system ATPase subunit